MTDQTPAEIRAEALREGTDAIIAEIWRGSRFSHEDARHPGLCEAVDVLRRLTDESLPRDSLAAVLAEVRAERTRQDAGPGRHDHPDGTGPETEMLPSWTASELADAARNSRQVRADMNICTWSDVLSEKTCEALAEDDPAKLRAGLIQIADTATAWIQAIDRRTTTG